MLSYLIRKLFSFFERKEDLYSKYAMQVDQLALNPKEPESAEEAIHMVSDFAKIVYHYSESLAIHIHHRGAQLPLSVFSDRHRPAYRLQAVRRGEYISYTPVINVAIMLRWMMTLDWSDSYRLTERTGYYSVSVTSNTWATELDGDLTVILELLQTAQLFLQKLLEHDDPRRVLSYLRPIMVYISIFLSLVHEVLADAGWLEEGAS